MPAKMKCCPFCGAGLTESVVTAFLRAECVHDSRTFESAADLYAAYRKWCRGKKIEPVTTAAFGRSLGVSGLISHRGHVVRWFGIRLRNRRPEPRGKAGRRVRAGRALRKKHE